MKYKVKSQKHVDMIRVASLLFPEKTEPIPSWVMDALKSETMKIEGTACVVVRGNMVAEDDDAIVCLADGLIVVLSAETFAALFEPLPTK